MDKESVKCAVDALAKRVAPVYTQLNWRWGRLRRPPNEKEIREELLELYKQLSSEELDEGVSDGSVGTGGLEVYRYRDEERRVHYVFRFKIEEYLDWHEQMAFVRRVVEPTKEKTQ